MKIKDFLQKCEGQTEILLVDGSSYVQLKMIAADLFSETSPDWLIVAAPLLLEMEVKAWWVSDGVVTIEFSEAKRGEAQ